jgi:hypothetical protein
MPGGSAPGPVASAMDQRGENVEQSEQGRAGFIGARRVELEFEEIEARQTFDRGTTSNRVVTSTLTRRHPARSLRDIERDRNRCTIELIG